jgi:hypothetical protein
MKRNYLMLISASEQNAKAVLKMKENINCRVDSNAEPLWIDAKGVGIFITTELVAAEIWTHAVTDMGTQLETIRDLLIVELGSDWLARRDAKTEHWLATHVGQPFPVLRQH